mmetsp:Transcript_34203/g.46081  ORF Transcript_34203/g.46081 Transcript_34203/m.46081 type:complete len:296 (-) Transcript_34203:476-1363(-)
MRPKTADRATGIHEGHPIDLKCARRARTKSSSAHRHSRRPPLDLKYTRTTAGPRVCTSDLQAARSGLRHAERSCAHRSVRPLSLLHVAVDAYTGAATGHVHAKHGVGVCVRASLQRFLRSLLVLVLAHPGDNACLLQGLAVREGQMPRQLALVKLVHRHQVDGRHFLVVLVQRCLPREEEDARHCRGHRAEQGLHSVCCHCVRVNPGPGDASLDHVRLQDRAFEVDVVERERRELSREHLLCHPGAVLDVVSAIGHDLGLHNGHEALALADGGVACQGVRRVGDRQVAGQALLRV